MVLTRCHHECLHAAITRELQLGSERKLAVGFTSDYSMYGLDVGFFAYACEAVTLFAKKAEKAVFALNSHYALERFLCTVVSGEFGTGVSRIQTPGAAARPLKIRLALDVDEHSKRVCTTVMDAIPSISLSFSLGVVVELVHQVALAIDKCVAMHFAPDVALFLTNDEYRAVHESRHGLQKITVELDRMSGGRLPPIFTPLVAMIFGIERFCKLYGMDGADDMAFRRSLIDRHAGLREILNETPAVEVAWSNE